MTENLSCHLLDILAEVPDPHHKKGKRHPLNSILALIVIGLLVNHKGYTSIATWVRNQPELTTALGFTSPKTPCAATIHNLLKRLDVVRLEATLTKWVFAALERYQASETQDLQGVAIDGKELCGSKDPETGFRKHLRFMAALRNTALSVLRFNGYTKIAETLRLFASARKLAVNLIR